MISQDIFKELMQYISHIHDTTKEKTIKKDLTETELILSCLVCLQEECGELASEVRKLTKMSFNQKKVDSFTMDDLQEERVDILIVLLLLAKQVGMSSIDEAVIKKIRKNNERGY